MGIYTIFSTLSPRIGYHTNTIPTKPQSINQSVHLIHSYTHSYPPTHPPSHTQPQPIRQPTNPPTHQPYSSAAVQQYRTTFLPSFLPSFKTTHASLIFKICKAPPAIPYNYNGRVCKGGGGGVVASSLLFPCIAFTSLPIPFLSSTIPFPSLRANHTLHII